MWTLMAFIVGVAAGVIGTILVYYNNTQKFLKEIESLRGERDALKGRLEALIDYLRGKAK